MNREKRILSYVSMAGTDLNQKIITRKKAIEKVYFLLRENGIKVTRKTVTILIDLEINQEFKEQKNYFFYNIKA